MSEYHGYDDLDEEEEEKEVFEWSKDRIVFLIDTAPSMLVKPEDESLTGGKTYLEAAVAFAVGLMKARVISSPSDEIAIVFYGTLQKKNESGFDYVYCWQDEPLDKAPPLRPPSADRIRRLSAFNLAQFERKAMAPVEGADPAAVSSALASGEPLKWGLWVANQLLQAHRPAHAANRIMLFTNEEQPCASPEIKSQILKRVDELEANGTKLEFFPLAAAQAGSFDTAAFWQDALLARLKDEEDDRPAEQVAQRMKHYQEEMRMRKHKKRPTQSLRFQITPGVAISLQAFSLAKRAKPGAAGLSWAGSVSATVVRERKWLSKDTGEILNKADLTKKYYKLTQASKGRFQKEELLTFTTAELAAIKTFGPPGLQLLGTKPLRCLAGYHQLREPYFLYPNEKDLKGSTAAFTAFLQALIDQDRMAVCRYCRKNAEPRLVALLPQPEEVTNDGIQEVPPGLHMIFLPFADDIREPECDPAIIGDGVKIADADQVAAASALIDAMALPPGFSTARLPNPHLARHCEVLECLALHEEPPAIEDFEEAALAARVTGAAVYAAAAAFRAATLGAAGADDVVAKKAQGTKRKAEQEAADDTDYASYDWRNAAASGELNKLTIDRLKVYLRHHRLTQAGKKAELIDRIKAHLGY